MEIIEAVARALALEYYRGQYRERYSDPRLLRTYGGPVADQPETAQLWIEEQAQDMARRFWNHWHAESTELLRDQADARRPEIKSPCSPLRVDAAAPGDVVIDAVIRAAAINGAIVEENGTIYVWAANAPEQIEAALAEAGWSLRQNV